MLDVMTTEKPTIQRIYVMLKDPVTGANKSFTVYGATIADICRRLAQKDAKPARTHQR